MNVTSADISIFPKLIEEARVSDSKRAMHCLHSSNEKYVT